jgi:hypothetical protein
MTNDGSEREKPRHKASHVGAPAIFRLELACRHLNDAFESFGTYLVGSSISKPDWRDVDVVKIMPDEEFAALFPNAFPDGRFEHDARWLILTVSISAWLSAESGLPIDFKFQPQTFANAKHGSFPRHALGMRVSRPTPSETTDVR